jgi:two-component system, LytTR family, sensor kinase
MSSLAMRPLPMGVSRGRALYALVWLPCFGLYAAGIAASGATASQAIRGGLASVIPWAAGGLLVLRAARALPWPDEGRVRVVFIHFALAAAFIALTTAGWYGIFVLERNITRAGPTPFSWRVVPWQSLLGSLIYAALVCATYAQQYAARVREQSARAARAEVLRATAELAALRSQLNPHFILNTLHTLLGLVRRQPDLAEQAIERIGDLLRYGLRLHREGVDEVTLREEWQFACSYLDLEALRLGKRLQLGMVADEDAMGCFVPAFVLQPLVENAIRHAIAPRATGGVLRIEARRADGRLRLAVTDDGPGFSTATAGSGTGLGLQLLRERLQALYAGGAQLRVASTHEGTRAELELPVRLSPATDGA